MPILYSQNSDVCAAELDGEVCLFNSRTAEYLNLNASASAIWNLLDQPMSEAELVTALIERFDVSDQQCRQETRAFLNEATAQGIVKLENP